MKKILFGLAIISSLATTGCTNTQTIKKQQINQKEITGIEITKLKLKAQGMPSYYWGMANVFVVEYESTGAFDVMVQYYGYNNNVVFKFDSKGDFIESQNIGSVWIKDITKMNKLLKNKIKVTKI